MIDTKTSPVFRGSAVEDVGKQWLKVLRGADLPPFAALELQDIAQFVRGVIRALYTDTNGLTGGGQRTTTSSRTAARSAVALARRVNATLPQLTHSLFLLEEVLASQIEESAQPSTAHCRAISAFFHKLIIDVQEMWACAENGRRLSDPFSYGLAAGEVLNPLDEFIYMASHELRTPLTSVKAYTQLTQRRLEKMATTCPLRAGPTPCASRELTENLRIVAAQVNRLSRLVNELVETALLRTGRFRLFQEQMNLVEVVRSAVESFQELMPGRRVTLEATGEALMALIDADRLVQVVHNLLSNAARFSPEGAPIEVRIKRLRVPRTSGQDWAEVSVADHGMGIAREDLPHVFKRFFRSSNPEARQLAGLGLGLYVSEKIVSSHGGRMRVESEPGVGSTFYFEIPLVSFINNGT